MGSTCSSRCCSCCGKKNSDAKDEDTVEEEEEERVFDTSKIFWDEKGNLRYGEEHSISREKQMQMIMELDFVDDTQPQEWYIMDTAWVNSWLAYVHTDKYVAPAPGPCDNRRLITWDAEQKKYVGRFGLQMGTKDHGGDYRRVSKATWSKYLELYPCSGPAITMEFNPAKKVEGGWYDTSGFNILNPPDPPMETVKKHKKKKKKKDKKEEEENEDSEQETPLVANDDAVGAASVGANEVEDRQPDSDDDDLAPDEIATLNANTGAPVIRTKNEPKINYQKVNRQSGDDPASAPTKKYEQLLPED